MQTHNIEKSKTPVPRKSLLAVALALAAIAAQATTYYWIPGKTQGLWTNLSNWSNETENVASVLPGSSDTLYNNGDYNFNLDAGSYTLMGWPTPGDWNNHYLTLANGTLTFTGEVSTHSGQINVNTDGNLVLPNGSSLVLGIYTSAGMTVNANSGGSISVAGNVRLYSGSFVVADGGSLTFEPSYLRYGADEHAYTLGISNAGTLTLPNGFAFDRWDILTVDTGSTFALSQTSGILNLGGSIANAPTSSSSKPGPFSVAISGGTVNATEDVTFDVTSLTIANSVTFNVSAEKLLDLSPAVFDSGASITKTGAGVVRFNYSNLPDSLAVSGGSILLDMADESYDISSVAFAENTKIAIGATGITLSNFDSSISNAGFETADGFSPENGATVLTCSDASVLANAQSGLNASLAGTGISLKTVGSSLVAEAHFTFNSSSVTDLNDEAGWVNGLVASAGQPATISGASTTAVMDESGFTHLNLRASGGMVSGCASRNFP